MQGRWVDHYVGSQAPAYPRFILNMARCPVIKDPCIAK